MEHRKNEWKMVVVSMEKNSTKNNYPKFSIKQTFSLNKQFKIKRKIFHFNLFESNYKIKLFILLSFT